MYVLLMPVVVFGMECRSLEEIYREDCMIKAKNLLHRVRKISGNDVVVLKDDVVALIRDINGLFRSSFLSDSDKEIPCKDQDDYFEKEKNRAKEFYKSKLEKDEYVKNFACKMIDKAKGIHQLDDLDAGIQLVIGSSLKFVNRWEGKSEIIGSVILGTSNESDRRKVEEMYQSDPYKMLEDFDINIEVVKGTYCLIIHEVGHAIHYFNRIRNLSENRECQNNNRESVSVFFEVLTSDPLKRGMRLRDILSMLGFYIKGYRQIKLDPLVLPEALYKIGYNDRKRENFRPLDCLLSQRYVTALYKAFKLSDRISAGEISVLEGMDEAIYGKTPDLTPDQFYELVDRLAS